MENQAIAWKGDETYKVIRGNSREIAAGDILISDEENANRWWEYSWNSCTPGIIRCIWAEMNVELDGPPNPIMIEWPVLIETIRTANFIPKDQILEKKRRTHIGTKVLTRDKKPTLEIRSYMRFCCLKNQVLHIELSITPVQFIQVLNPLILHLLTIFICVLITLTVHFKCHFEGELQKAEK